MHPPLPGETSEQASYTCPQGTLSGRGKGKKMQDLLTEGQKGKNLEAWEVRYIPTQLKLAETEIIKSNSVIIKLRKLIL